MKKMAIKIGGVIAILIMFAPIYIILNYKHIESYYIWLIISIFYDIYMYSVIEKENYMEEKKEIFEKVQTGKTIESDTEEKKFQWYRTLCIDIFNEYFKNK